MVSHEHSKAINEELVGADIVLTDHNLNKILKIRRLNIEVSKCFRMLGDYSKYGEVDLLVSRNVKYQSAKYKRFRSILILIIGKLLDLDKKETKLDKKSMKLTEKEIILERREKPDMYIKAQLSKESILTKMVWKEEKQISVLLERCRVYLKDSAQKELKEEVQILKFVFNTFGYIDNLAAHAQKALEGKMKLLKPRKLAA